MTTTATTVTTNEELAVCIREGNTELLPELWENTRRFIYQQAGRYYRRLSERCAAAGVTVEDLEQEGYFALVDAVAAYDGRYNLLTYLTYPLLNRYNALAGMRQRRNDPLNRNGTRSLDEPLTDDSDFTLADTVPDPRDHYEEAEEHERNEQLHNALEEALSKLDNQLAGVIRRKHYDGLTFRQIGQIEGVPPEIIRQREAKAMRKMRVPKISGELRAFIEESTDYYHRVGVRRFQQTHTSAVEGIVLKREALRNFHGTSTEIP